MKKVKRIKYDHRGWFTQGKIYLVDEEGYVRDDDTGRRRMPCFSREGYWQVMKEEEEKLSCPPPAPPPPKDKPVFTANPCAEIALPTNEQENNMSTQYHTQPAPVLPTTDTPVKTITYVFGQDIQHMTDNMIMSSIKRAQVEIKALADMEVASIKIQSLINDLEAAVSLMVEKLDEDCEG